jgi:hypothetical protein
VESHAMTAIKSNVGIKPIGFIPFKRNKYKILKSTDFEFKKFTSKISLFKVFTRSFWGHYEPFENGKCCTYVVPGTKKGFQEKS